MHGLKNFIEYFNNEKYHDIAYGTIYYVAGTASHELNNYMLAQIEHIEQRINQSENNWVTCKIVYLDQTNPLFTPGFCATLYSPLLPTENTSEEVGACLTTSLEIYEQAELEDAFVQHFQTLQKLFDDVLDTGTYDERHLRPETAFRHTLSFLDSVDVKTCAVESCDIDSDVMACEAAPMEPCGEIQFSVSSPVPMQPGRLVITSHASRIYIPDYNIDIHFTPQVKALYILFLNHPGGIRMSEIEDYKEEYKHIFFQVSDRSNKDWMRRSVERLIDVCNPQALNVKKSQCAEQLRKAIPDAELRRHYEIEVHRGMPHTISLDRSLVDMPDDLWV
ncbi:MAG: hypothetical protein IKG83_09350 [Prevotella sp.]|nr:hypothetical protein [Prevotella sp.]